jgi:hypothetical protein
MGGCPSMEVAKKLNSNKMHVLESGKVDIMVFDIKR